MENALDERAALRVIAMGSSVEELVGVAFVGDRGEAEMIQRLLRTAGIPSVLQGVGVDGPQVGHLLLNPGGGAQQVMVHPSQVEAAHALLAETVTPVEPESWADTALAEGEAEGRGPRSYGLVGALARIWAWSLGSLALAFGIFMLLRIL